MQKARNLMITASVRRGLALACTLVLALGATACSTNKSLGDQVDDGWITSKVKAKLAADPEINPFKIDVDTDQGVVRLSGVVEERSTRSEAVKLARRTKGVERVINDIEIGDRDFKDRVDDATIVTKIKAKLTADPEVSPFNVDVDCVEGVVTLSGRVSTRDAKKAAEGLASRTDGVRKVRNRLVIDDD